MRYMRNLHKKQVMLLKEVYEKGQIQGSFREIGKLIALSHPESVRHHLTRLMKLGFIDRGDRKNYFIPEEAKDLTRVTLEYLDDGRK